MNETDASFRPAGVNAVASKAIRTKGATNNN